MTSFRLKLAASALMLVLIVLAFTSGLDRAALQVHDATMQRAMAAFVMAKGLNAVISLVQGTELSFTPVGIGLTFSVGEVLDPLNDLVERFSWVMLLSAVSLGIQKLLLTFSSLSLVMTALAGALATAMLAVWVKPLQRAWSITLLARAVALLLLLRFATVGFVYLQYAGYEHLMASDYETAAQNLQETETTLQQIEQQQLQLQHQSGSTESAEESWMPEILDKASTMFDDAAKSYDKAVAVLDIPKLSESVDKAQDHVITLITIFVVQTVLMPLLYLWLLLHALKWLFGPRFEPAAIYDRMTGKQL